MKPVLFLIFVSMALVLTALAPAVLVSVALYFIVLAASGAAAWRHNARQVRGAVRAEPPPRLSEEPSQGGVTA